jgi:hypothetical protein
MLFADQLNEMTEQMVESMDSELDGTSAVRQVDATVVLKRIVNAAEGAQSAMDNEIDGLLKEIATAKA